MRLNIVIQLVNRHSLSIVSGYAIVLGDAITWTAQSPALRCGCSRVIRDVVREAWKIVGAQKRSLIA